MPTKQRWKQLKCIFEHKVFLILSNCFCQKEYYSQFHHISFSLSNFEKFSIFHGQLEGLAHKKN